MDVSFLLVAIPSIVIAMTVHEATHAYVGLLLGDTTAAEQGRVSLNPFRHVDPFATIILPIVTYILFRAPILAAKPVPFSPTRVRFGEMGAGLIAAAGPVSNLLLAIIAALLLRWTGGAILPADIFLTFISLNISLFVFNLIPIPPLDGSRVLYAFAPESVQQFIAGLEQYGLFLILGLAAFGVFNGVLATFNSLILGWLL